MLTHETLRLLKTLLMEIARGEIKLEQMRQKLAVIKEFEPYAAF